MPNKVKRNSVVELLAKVPVNRGSLLKSIENLLKTIESSESAVMIPTLLRDKCEFDAWELLFVAKILKASILGHSDLVEFYMNHMGHTFAQQSNGGGYSVAGSTINGIGGSQDGDAKQQTGPALSPSQASGGQSSPVSSMAPQMVLVDGGGSVQVASMPPPLLERTSPSSSSVGSTNGGHSTVSSSSTNGVSPQQQQQLGGGSKSQSSVSWVTANNQQSAGSNSVGNSISSGSLSSSIGSAATNEAGAHHHNHSSSSASSSSSSEGLVVPSAEAVSAATAAAAAAAAQELLAARPLLVRQAQPPSLLQLTTTNNHINSVAACAAGFTNNSIEQLTSQLTAMQANGCLSGAAAANVGGSSNGLDGALSISTCTANQQSAAAAASASSQSTATTGAGAQPTPELRTSRSAGCLFRINSSGASSPRTPAQTPTTPYPQAETLANGLTNKLAGDPSAPVKLLLQIEQLKSSIGHVTSLLESVVELYKKSIDNIAMA